MFCRLFLIALLAGSTAHSPAEAATPLKVVATFSIIGDFAKNIGGAEIPVETLVGPDGNAHAYTPTPFDSKKLANAYIIFTNGLGFEGWLDRLVRASGTKARIVVVSDGITPRQRNGENPDDQKRLDPHAWQSVSNAKVYVANIRNALIAADPDRRPVYEGNAAAYLGELDRLDRDIRDAIASLPPQKRTIVTNHDAFGYFQDAYGLTFAPVQGFSNEAEPSAKNLAGIITAVKQNSASAIFLENVSDPRLMQQIGAATGVRVGGTLYTDALTGEQGNAPNYIALMRHNLKQLTEGLGR